LMQMLLNPKVATSTVWSGSSTAPLALVMTMPDTMTTKYPMYVIKRKCSTETTRLSLPSNVMGAMAASADKK